LQGTCSMTATEDTRTFSLQQDFLRVDRVEIGSNRELEVISRDYVAAVYGTDWRVATGQPMRAYVEDVRNIGLHPLPTSGNGTTTGSAIMCYGPIYARPMTADSGAGGTTRVPTALQDAVVDYVCREVASRDASDNEAMAKKVGYFQQQLEAEIGRYKHVRPDILTIGVPGR